MIFVNVCAMKLKRQLMVQRRGAMLALMAIARNAGANLHDDMLPFWDAMFGPLTAVSGKFSFFIFSGVFATKKSYQDCMHFMMHLTFGN